MSFKDLRVRLIGDASSLTNSLNVSEKKLKAFGDRAKRIGQNLSLKLTAPLVLAGGAAIKFASDFQESLNKVDVAFGKSSKSVKEFAKTSLKQFGIAEGSALDMAALFGDMATSMGISQNAAAGMSTQLVGLAGDLASFKNIDIEQATTALAGVFTGETESLKRLGIVMTEVNLKQFAMEKGLDGNIKKMTESEKVALRFQYILEKTANSQGDFARTGGGAANQMRIFQESLKQLAANFGQIILPAFTKILIKVNSFLEKISEMDPTLKKVIVVFAAMAAAIGPILVALPSLAAGFTMVAGAVGALTGPIAIVLGSITALSIALPDLDKKLGVQTSLWTKLKNLFLSGGNAANYIGRQLSEGEPILDDNKTKVEETTQAYENLIKKVSKSVLPLSNINKATTVKGDDFGKAKVKSIAQPKGFKFQDPASAMASNVADGNILLEENMTQTGEIISAKQFEYAQNATEFNSQLGSIFEGGLQNLAVGIGEALGSAIATGGNLGQQLGAVLLGTLGGVATQIGQMAIGIGFALEGIKKALESLNPVVAIAAGIALVALGAFFKSKSQSISKSMGKGGKGGGRGPTPFAKGGIVSSPTLGLIGEYAGASRNPEVVAPLDKLQSMIGDRNGKAVNVTGDFKLRGQDLLVAIDRAEKYRDRIQ
jgi:hypothetical protein